MEFLQFICTLTGVFVWLCVILLTLAYALGFVSFERMEEHDGKQ